MALHVNVNARAASVHFPSMVSWNVVSAKVLSTSSNFKAMGFSYTISSKQE